MMRAHTIIAKDFSVRFYSIMWPMILMRKDKIIACKMVLFLHTLHKSWGKSI